MKWLLIILGVIIGLIVLVTIVGLFLPRQHVATRTIRLKQPVENVWATITDHVDEPSWRSGLQAKERLEDRDGREVWREVRGRGDTLTLMTLERDPPRRIVGQVVDNAQFGGTWTYLLAPADGGGCTLTITENGDIRNPIFRAVARFIIGYEGTIDAYLRDLARQSGDQAEPG